MSDKIREEFCREFPQMNMDSLHGEIALHAWRRAWILATEAAARRCVDLCYNPGRFGNSGATAIEHEFGLTEKPCAGSSGS